MEMLNQIDGLRFIKILLITIKYNIKKNYHITFSNVVIAKEFQIDISFKFPKRYVNYFLFDRWIV